MEVISVREIAAACLGKSGQLSIKKDVLGVHGYSFGSSARSLKQGLDRILNKPFVRVAVVTVRPVGSVLSDESALQRNIDDANEILLRNCGAWVYCTGTAVVFTNAFGEEVILDQDCLQGGTPVDEVTIDEFDLFNLGRDLGANVVCYYIGGSSAGIGVGGCGAHPGSLRGFWVRWTVPEEHGNQYTFAHELCHVVGGLRHVSDTDNLMHRNSYEWTALPPDLTESQRTKILDDPDMKRCHP